MGNYQYCLFDLDGTLTDSEPGIVNSVIYALKKNGIEETDRIKLRKFIGPPLIESFREMYGFTKEQAKQTVQWYREYYSDQGMFENSVYEGIRQLLVQLKAEGRILIVATSKPEKFARIILEYFDLAKYFDLIAGAGMDEKRTHKDEVIAYAMERMDIRDKEKVIMIGDREYDVIGAKKNGVRSMGVLFGFGSRKELETAGADYIAETPEEIKSLLKN